MLRLHIYQIHSDEPNNDRFWSSIGDACVGLGIKQIAPSQADKDQVNGSEGLYGLTMA